MNLNTQKKVNWSNIIILPEFYNYLELEELKEVSLISKLIRYNLKPTLFFNIEFKRINYEYYFNNSENLFYGYFEYIPYYFENATNEGFDTTPYKSLKIDSALKELKDQFINFKLLVNSFDLTSLGRATYYILPILSVFDNLTLLNLDNCMIHLVKFDKLINSLKKLDTIELNDSEFVIQETENFTIDEVKFPSTLEKLSIWDCKMGITKIEDPIDFLFSGDDNYIRLDEFIFPKTSIPSLKILEFEIMTNTTSGVNQFLEKNPQLECLTFELAQLDQFLVNYIEKSNCVYLEITSDCDLVHQIHIPTLTSINQIEVSLYNEEAYSTLQKLCLSCSNLTDLSFRMCSSNTDETLLHMKNFQNDIVFKSYNLKALSLTFFLNLEDFINYENLNRIEELTINSYYDSIINIEFNKFKNLKLFSFYLVHVDNADDNEDYIESKFNINDVKVKFERYSDWKFIFGKETLKGYKI